MRIKEALLRSASLVPGLAFLLWLLLSPAVLLEASPHFTLFDDAMISMSYARTLVETGEWVWFPGAPRVQGFTNPGWTLFLAALHAVGLSGSGAALAVGLTGIILILAGALVSGQLVAWTLGNGRVALWASLGATATIPLIFPLAFWSVRGMEVGLLALLAVLTSGALARAMMHSDPSGFRSRDGAVAIIATVVGVVTRIDFVLIPIAVSGALWIFGPALCGRKRSQYQSVLYAGILTPVLAVIAVALFQWFYWGDFLPNTYYLKMTGFDLRVRLQRGILTSAKVMPMVAAVGLALWVSIRGSRSDRVRMLSVAWTTVFLASVGYSIWVGGDAWETFKMANRYVVVGLPVAVAVCFIALGVVLEQRVTAKWGTIVVLLAGAGTTGLLIGVQTNPVSWSKSIGLASALLFVLLLSALLMVLMRTTPGSPLRAFGAVVITALALVALTSFPRLPISLLVGFPPDAVSDAEMTQRGQWLRQMTSNEATVASLWAGAPIYYSQRSAIDLLGKSDAYIARKAPNDVPDPSAWNHDFYPGHNKWDLAYSVLGQLPDIVLNYLGTVADTDQLLAAGYRRYCLPDQYPILVRADSKLVSRELLAECALAP